MIALGCALCAVERNLHGLTQKIDGGHITGAVGGQNEGIVLGHTLDGIFIGILLIFQTAHESAAGAGDLGGVQAQRLGLCHLDGNGHEAVEERSTAEGSAADAETAQHLRLVTDTDLAQLDSCAEDRGQILHQLTEVHTAFGGEEENDLVALKVAGNVHQLHIQLMLGDLALADLRRFLFALTVVQQGAAVAIGSDTDHGAEGLHDALLGHLMVALHTLGIFHALCSLHDHVLTRLHTQCTGVEIIDLASATEADRNNSFQRISSSSAAREPRSSPTPAL